MLCAGQTGVPVVSSSATTSLPVVTAKKTPLPLGPFSRYSGDAHMLPVKVPANVVSRAIVAASALVRVG